MKQFQAIVYFAFLAAACTAALAKPAGEPKPMKSEEDRDLQTAVALALQAVDNWIEANDGLEPAMAERRLEGLITEILDHYKLISAIEDEEDEDEDEDEVRAHGLGKKLKKWKNKVKKVVGDAAKAVVVNKVVGAAAGALG